MIEGFEHPHPTEPTGKSRWQGFPALASGIIAGIVLLIVPHASPWSGLTSFTPAILGRVVPAAWNMPALAAVALHVVLSLLYGFIISLIVMHIRELRAVFMGGVVGLLLYLVNLAVVSMLFPAMKGNEVSVFVTHVVFGLIAAGTYRGLLRRQMPAQTSSVP